MKIWLIPILTVIGLIALAVMIRELLILLKRQQRRCELRHHIDMILDPNVCAEAITHYHACEHIVEHYRVNLADQPVNFSGDLYDLWTEVGKSLQRAEKRKESTPM